MPDGRNYGYIDLLVMGKGFCYPIEVKDWAVDGEDPQTAGYCDWNDQADHSKKLSILNDS